MGRDFGSWGFWAGPGPWANYPSDEDLPLGTPDEQGCYDARLWRWVRAAREFDPTYRKRDVGHAL